MFVGNRSSLAHLLDVQLLNYKTANDVWEERAHVDAHSHAGNDLLEDGFPLDETFVLFAVYQEQRFLKASAL